MLSKQEIENYFIAEKSASLLFLIIGITGVILSAVFFFGMKSSGIKASALPLLLIGLLQFGVGFTVYSKADEQRKSNVYAFDMNPDQLKQLEVPRMRKVVRNFVIFRWIEITGVLAGIILIWYSQNHPYHINLIGVGLVVFIESILALGADHIASQRAEFYLQQLDAFAKKTG